MGNDNKFDHYENPGHHDPIPNNPGRGTADYDTGKSVLPDNHLALFLSSRSYPNKRKVRYARDSEGNIHQFQDSGWRTYHWAGSQVGVTRDGERKGLSLDRDQLRFARSIPLCRE